MKKVMGRAWEIAREGKEKFGGKVKEYLPAALSIAWKEEKMDIERETVSVSSNEWKNYGKHRIYFDASISLIEHKIVNGNRVGAIREVSHRGYYNAQDNNIYSNGIMGKGMASASDEVDRYMATKIKELVKSEIEKHTA